VNELALFAGAGGGILGGHLLGWRTVCAVEWEAYPASVLVARQNDKILSPFPIWDDVQTFDGTRWRGIVDVVSGGFPCQDISAAGKGDGLDGERSGLWKEMARIIGEVRPKYAFIENSPMLTTRGLERVLADLAKMGFDAEWGVLSAADVGANHKRDRIWIVGRNTKWQLADTDLCRHLHGQIKIDSTIGRFDALSQFGTSGSNVANTRCKYGKSWNSTRMESDKKIRTFGSIYSKSSGKGQLYNSNCKNVERQWEIPIGIKSSFGNTFCSSWWKSEPNVGRVANGVAARVDRLKAIGNGQVPLCAATAWNILKGRINGKS
jgi:DNA (cytosine-5)-methyltransferase 1